MKPQKQIKNISDLQNWILDDELEVNSFIRMIFDIEMEIIQDKKSQFNNLPTFIQASTKQKSIDTYKKKLKQRQNILKIRQKLLENSQKLKTIDATHYIITHINKKSLIYGDDIKYSEGEYILKLDFKAYKYTILIEFLICFSGYDIAETLYIEEIESYMHDGDLYKDELFNEYKLIWDYDKIKECLINIII